MTNKELAKALREAVKYLGCSEAVNNAAIQGIATLLADHFDPTADGEAKTDEAENMAVREALAPIIERGKQLRDASLIEGFTKAFSELVDMMERASLAHAPAPETTGPWEPKYEDRVWALEADGEIWPRFYEDDAYERGMLAQGNSFRTEEEAELERDRREIRATLARQSEGLPWPKRREREWTIPATDYRGFPVSVTSRRYCSEADRDKARAGLSDEDLAKLLDRPGE